MSERYEYYLRKYEGADKDTLRDMTYLLDPDKDAEELQAIYELLPNAEPGPTTMRGRFGSKNY